MKKGQFNSKSNTISNAKIKSKLHWADAFEIDFLLLNSAAQRPPFRNAITLELALAFYVFRYAMEIVVYFTYSGI